MLADDGLEVAERRAVAKVDFEHFHFSVFGRVAHREHHHETIELCGRERIGAFVFEWIHRGDGDEWERELVRRAFDGDLAFFHHFEQGRLRFGWRAVDFVGKQNIRENRASVKLEGLRAHVENVRACHIHRKKIRRELNALEGAIDARGECLGEHGFADAGHVAKKNVPLRGHGP